MELSDYEQERRSDRQLYVKIHCEVCQAEKWVRWTRIKKGQGRFCSKECFDISQKKSPEYRMYVGYENAKKVFDKAKNSYYVYWLDMETLQRHTTTYAKWYWEVHNGPIPKGYRASYRDGNPMNIDPNNIIIISPKKFGDRVSERLMGHGFSEETKKKLSEKKKGRELPFDHKKKISDSLRKRWDNGEFDSVHVGEHNSHWRGGIDKKYPKEFNTRLKNFIWERDKSICQICKRVMKSRRSGNVHHISGNRNDNTYDNLVLLCKGCHNKIHSPSKEMDEIMAFRSKLYWS